MLAFMDQERELWLAISFISAGVALIQPGHLALVHTLFPTEKLGKEIGILSSGNTIGYAFGGGLAALLLGVNIYKFALLMILVLLIAVVMNTLRIRT